MPDCDKSSNRTRSMKSNDRTNIRQRMNKMRFIPKQAISVEYSNSCSSTSSSSSSTFQNENQKSYHNQQECKHQHEDENSPADFCNSCNHHQLGYIDNLRTTCDKDLPSPATQMSFSYLKNPVELNKTPLTRRIPFRNRFFASAALVSNQQQKYHQRELEWEKDAPPISSGVSWGSIANLKNEAYPSANDSPGNEIKIPSKLVVQPKYSQVGGRWKPSSSPLSSSESYEYNEQTSTNRDCANDNDPSYESFGNHSVYSDLSGSEFSNVFSLMPSKERLDYDDSLLFRNSSDKNTSAPQEALLEAHAEFIENGVDFQEEKEANTELNECELQFDMEKNQHMNEMYRRKQIEIAKCRRNHGKDSVKINTESGKKTQGRGKILSSRIASLFSNQSSSADGIHDTEGGDKDEVTPKKTASPISSPSRSYISGASSRYQGWPGTLDKNGSTLEVSSNFSAVDRKIPEKNDLKIEKHLTTNSLPKNKNNNRNRVDCDSTNTSPKSGINISDEETDKQSGVFFTQSLSKSNMEKVKLRYKGDIVDLDDDMLSSTSSIIRNPADFHLAAVVANAASPCSSIQDINVLTSEQSTISELDTNFTHTHSMTSTPFVQNEHIQSGTQANPMMETKAHKHMVDRSGKEKKSSRSVQEMHCQKFETPFKAAPLSDTETIEVSKIIDTSASLRRIQSAGKEMHSIHYPTYSSPDKQVIPSQHLRKSSHTQSVNCTHLSENVLKEKDRLNPVHIRGSNIKGYRGFFDKTRDVPNLIDNDIDSVTTASTHVIESDTFHNIVNHENDDEDSEIFDDLPNISETSDVFDDLTGISGLSKNVDNLPTISKLTSPKSKPMKSALIQHDGYRSKGCQLQDSVGRFGIQALRDTANLAKPRKDFMYHGNGNQIRINESQLKSQGSDIDIHSLSSGSASRMSRADFSKYVIEPSQIRKLVRKFRNMCQALELKGNNSSYEEDSKKAFALFEMRSRVMETDIRRGLERTGGTVVVDDIILTSYNQAAHRIRDAIIVSKAWRDGANPKDARTASLLMNSDSIYHIKRVVRSIYNSASPSRTISNQTLHSKYIPSNKHPHQLYSWEKVSWIDDTEFSLLRCPSLGPRSMRGFEMFTIGDCQSILLKLTYERCEELRELLKKAISRQLLAEQSLGEELDVNDADLSFMTDAETTYLQAMEDVKIISQNLANAEKSFYMVRDKIEKLVMKYETLLEEIKNDENSVTSLNSDISTEDDDDFHTESIESHLAEKEKLTERALRAELKAEVAAREAEKSKQEAEKIKYEKQEELEALQKKLEELETRSAHMASEFEMKLNDQKLLVSSISKGSSSSQPPIPPKSDSGSLSVTETHSLLYAASHIGLDQEKIDAKMRIKERFRQRNSQGSSKSANIYSGSASVLSKNKQKITGKVHQQLQFYERSLQAVK